VIEAYDVWLVFGAGGLLLTAASLVGSAIMVEWPFKGALVGCASAFCLYRAFVLAEDPLGWTSPIESAVRVFGAIF